MVQPVPGPVNESTLGALTKAPHADAGTGRTSSAAIQATAIATSWPIDATRRSRPTAPQSIRVAVSTDETANKATSRKLIAISARARSLLAYRDFDQIEAAEEA